VTWPVALPLLTSAGAVGVLGALRLRSSGPLMWRELLMPEELSADEVAALLRHIAAVREGPVCVTVRAAQGRLRFFVAAPDSGLSSLMAAGGGLIAEARFEDVESLPAVSGKVVLGARVGWDGPWPLLRTDDPQLTVAGILGVLASVGRSEQLELRLRLWPVGRVHRPVASSERRNVPANPWFMRAWWPAQPPREDLRAIRAKYSGLLLSTEVIVVSGSGTAPAAAANAQRLIASLRAASGIRGVLRYRTIQGSAQVRRVTQRRRPPLPWELHCLLSPEELAAVAGLPVEAPKVQGIAYGAGPRLMPPVDMPTRGRVFATSNFSATAGQPLGWPVLGGLQHAALIGPTGSGKSTANATLVRADMVAGRGAFVLDLKGDLVEDLLGLVPPGREQDVVVLEPARGGAQPGLKLFPAGSDPELTSDLVLGTLAELFSDSWGIRSSQYLGLGLKTLAAIPDATLADLPLLFADAAFRARALRRVTDPWLQASWQRFLALSTAEQATHLASPLTKIGELVGRGRLRLVLGQSAPRLDFREVLARKRIVLVSLPPGLLGMPATQLLAALTLWQFFQAVEARAAIPRQQRSPFFAYVDEVAVLGSLPLPLDSILERARGHGVGLTLSPQALSQLSLDLRTSLLANVGSLVSFQQTSDDEARALAKTLPGVSAAQLQHLGRHEVAMRLSLGPGLVTQVMTGTTLPPEPPSSDPKAIRAAAAQHWGQTLEQIDQALKRRHGLADVSTDASDEKSQEQLGVTRRRP
jgi:Type IV secretion-system coupling protein DNA-binding domain